MTMRAQKPLPTEPLDAFIEFAKAGTDPSPGDALQTVYAEWLPQPARSWRRRRRWA